MMTYDEQRSCLWVFLCSGTVGVVEGARGIYGFELDVFMRELRENSGGN